MPAAHAKSPEAGRRDTTLDAESLSWLGALSGDCGERRAAAAAESLHELLLVAARATVMRRRRSLPHLRGNDLDDIAVQAADSALLRVVTHLSGFRGASRFSTWASKFAFHETLLELEKRDWQRHEVPLPPDRWFAFASPNRGPGEQAEEAELLAALRDALEVALTPYQRSVFVAVALNCEPVDRVASVLETTPGCVYKTLCCARRRLRAHLSDNGLGLDAWLATRCREAHVRAAQTPAPARQY